MKIAIAQINTTIGDFEGNRTKVVSSLKQAHQSGATLVVFPELALCGYPPMDLLAGQDFSRLCLESLDLLAEQIPEGMTALVGYVRQSPDKTGKSLQNVVSALQKGRVLHTQAKTLLPTYDVFDEGRYFEPAREWVPVEIDGVKVGIAICEDMWGNAMPNPGTTYREDPVAELCKAGAQVIVSPSASPFYKQKSRVRHGLANEISRRWNIPVAYANMVGGNDSLIFDGNSFFMNAKGELAGCASAFSEDLLMMNFDSLKSDAASFVFDEPGIMAEYEDALVIGIRDYIRKCGFKKVHLGLSGGIDSALVAVLAVKALGAENVSSFGMPSRYSSEGSVADARALAENLGISFDILPIEGMFSSTLDTLAGVFAGKDEDVTEENIQARIRGLLMMAYSNKFGSLLLTTGNKSELATGYCTLYGDMCGGLAVIGDLLKTEVFELCRFINRNGEVIPEATITKPPSAELRPDQKDEDSLPDYDTLDAILVQLMMQNRTPAEIIAAGFPEKDVTKIARLLTYTEYKRRQAPPVLKVSERAFGAGRQIPIARKG